MVQPPKSGVFSRYDVAARAGRATPVDCAEVWAELVGALGAEAEPFGTHDYWRLYALVASVAGGIQRREFPRLDASDAHDAAQRLLEGHLAAVLGARRTKAFVEQCIRNRLRDVFRSPRYRVAADAEAVLESRASGSEHALIQTMDQQAAYTGLDERTRWVLTQDAAGYPREEIGSALGLGRSGVDQIISRARRKLAAG